MDAIRRTEIHRRRHVAAGAVLAGAALLGAFGPSPARAKTPAPVQEQLDDGPAQGEAMDEMAFAIPRFSPGGGRWGGVGLPRPLDAADADRIRRIFTLQRNGGLAEADRLIAALDDRSLLGDVLADRYLAPLKKPTAASLGDWLKRYGDRYQAPRILAALRSASPSRAASVAITVAPALSDELADAPAPEEADPAVAAAGRSAPGVASRVSSLAEAGREAAALRLVRADRSISVLDGAVLRAEVARALLAQGRLAEALETGRDAASRSNGAVGEASFVAGLAAWKLGRIAEAATLFETATRAGLVAESQRAGAAFWAARAHLRLGDVEGYRPWMLRAAASKRTFYGMLAARRLGIGGWTPAVDDVGEEVLGEADVEALSALPDGRRAFALLQVGEKRGAELTLRHLWPTVGHDRALCRSIMLVAEAADLPDLASEIASILQAEDGRPRDGARFPVPALRPTGGFTLDPALVYALTRVESDFDPHAVSGEGAHGLMQIEPVTADYVLGRPDRFAADPARLQNASLNLEIGQRYVQYLAASGHVQGDLIRLLASYNAGPGKVAGWDMPAGGDGDPLLAIEQIPNAETRDFTHRALAYLWIYAARLDLPAPSLDALAADVWPSFAPEMAMAGEKITIH